MKRLIFFLLLSTFGFGQVMYIGPLNSPAIDPSSCIPSNQGQTGLCFASDGVHVSIAGQPFGAPLPASGPPGLNATITLGSVTSGVSAGITNTGTPQNAVLNFVLPQGPPGLIKGNTVLGGGSLTCAPQKGSTVASGFICNFTNLTFLVTSIQ